MVSNPATHPRAALYAGCTVPPDIACCDHYAGSEKLILKSMELQAQLGPCFDITIDLEDGASIGNERQLRDLALTMVHSGKNRFNQVGIRIHDPRSALWREDIQQIVRSAGARLSHLTVPKVTSAAEVAAVLALMQEAQKSANLSRSLPLHVLIETHGAVHEAWEIAKLDGVRGLDMGLMDFVSEHHGTIPSSAMISPLQFTHALITRAKTTLCAAAAAFGKIAAHNVTPQYDDEAQTRSDARMAYTNFGFTRMWSIHPKQIPAILDGMTPDTGEVALAAEVVMAGWKARWGPISHANRLHDRASFRYFWNVLERAHRTGTRLPEEVVQAFFSEPARTSDLT